MPPFRIYVCVKHVPDSAATITVVGADRIDTNITFLINPYDEHALTEAARLKERHGPAEVVAVCLGPDAAESTLRSAMAMGADRSILVVTTQTHDSIFTARALKSAIVQDGKPGIILTGKEAIDTEGMQTPFRLAANLGLPAATNVVKLTLEQGAAVAECEKESGSVDVLRLRLPCVIGAGKGLNTPRYPTFPDIMKSRKKDVRKVGLAALAIPPPESRMEIVELKPALENRAPKVLEGGPAEIARRIAVILKEEARVM
ncbi:MAG: electron transfer flavoprotein subunit beta/FixA family protein [Desulfobacterales bacterium]|jgi:electron transfer flavoprotein beta subunit|nr:electron transfer flavoprotein subunit beta/FixA family protein [Desulfobacterales bacterium]